MSTRTIVLAALTLAIGTGMIAILRPSDRGGADPLIDRSTGTAVVSGEEAPRLREDALGVRHSLETNSSAKTTSTGPEATYPMTARTEAHAILSRLPARAADNIRVRTEAMGAWYSMLYEERPAPANLKPGAIAHKIAQLAIMVEFDAAGRSIFRMDPNSIGPEVAWPPLEVPRVTPENAPKWEFQFGEAYRISSGGADYEIPIGEFSVYDEIQTLNKEFRGGAPIGVLPLDDLELLYRSAMLLADG